MFAPGDLPPPERKKPNLRKRRAFTIAALTAVVLSCGDDPLGPDGQTGLLILSPERLRFTALNDTLSLAVRSGDGVVGSGLTLISRDPSIVQITPGPGVASRAVGETWVIATFEEVTDSIPVLVTQVPVALDVGARADTLPAGDSATLTAIALDSRANVIPALVPVWSSADSTIVRIDEQSVAWAGRSGSVLLEASVGDVGQTLVITTIPGAAALLGIGADTVRMIAVGQTVQVDFVAEDAHANALPETAVAWTSRDPAVLSSLGDGRVASVTEGEAWLVVESGSLADSALIVIDQVVARIEVLPAAHTLNALGDTVRLVATGYDYLDQSVGDAEMEWATLDAAVATVDDSGAVVSATTGLARIHVRLGAFSDTAEIVSRQITSALALGPDTAALGIAEVLRVLRTVSDSNGTAMPDTVLTWATSDSSAVAIDAEGDASGLGGAGAWISATGHEVTDSVFVLVAPTGILRTWVGGDPLAPGVFGSPYNWRYAGGPNAQDTVYVPAGVVTSPTLAASDAVARVVVPLGASLSLGGFDLTVSHSVEAPGTFTSGTGRLRLTGIAMPVVGFTPRLVVTGSAIASTGALHIRQQLRVDGGRIQSNGQRIQVDNQ